MQLELKSLAHFLLQYNNDPEIEVVEHALVLDALKE